MIKKINHIKNFGVFQSYKRSGKIQDFAKINILYGWNYSGKTTISRIFQCFQNRKLHQHYPNAEFEVEDYNGNKGNHENLSINDYEIQVFNSDFIDENIHLEGERFNPILLLGEDSIKAQEEIKQKSKRIDRTETIINKLDSISKDIEKNIEDTLTREAASIKETLQIVKPFTKHHLKKILKRVKNDPNTYIISKPHVSDLLRKATSSNTEKLPKIADFTVTTSLSEKIKKANHLLTEVPQFTNTIQYFVDNPDIANWVEKGIPLHENKDVCEFCGNELDKKRVNNLASHFSKDLKNHRRKLDSLIDSVKNSKLINPATGKSDIYKDLWEEFEEKKQNLEDSITNYNNNLDQLIELLRRKKEEPFQKINESIAIEDNTNILKSNIEAFNNVLEKNRTKTKEFDKIKSEAIKSLKNHFAASFLKQFKLLSKKEKVSVYKNRIDLLSSSITQLQNEIEKIEAKISRAHKGKEKLNEYIHRFLGRDEIQVVVEKEGENERFRLKRNDAKAVNLSEGEKTAIAFSFYLTKLLEHDDLQDVIVYIDDPISSLDSNHIFQLNAILKDFFFRKEKPEHINPKLLTCKQLFVSTHNFEFFNLLGELPKLKDSNKFFYFIKRQSESNSTLDKLPKALKNYKSEYHYLFKLISDFKDEKNKDIDSAMILPNVIRRFVELYTYSRIPGDKYQTVDHRAQRLWGMEKSKRILKICHYFSHGNNIDRMRKHNEFICDIENAVEDLLNLISKNDQLHFNELKKSVS